MAPPSRKRSDLPVLATFYNEGLLPTLRARAARPVVTDLDTIAKFLTEEFERDGINATLFGTFALWLRGFDPFPRILDIAVGVGRLDEVRDIVDKYAGIYVCENVAREGEATEIFVSLPDLFAQRRVSFADNTPLACVSIFPRGHPVFPAFLDRNGEYIRRQWDCIKTVHKIVPPKNQFEVSLKAHFLHREETNLHLGHMVWLLTHYQPSIAERKYIIRHLMVLRDDLDARRIWVCLAIVKELIEQSFLL